MYPGSSKDEQEYRHKYLCRCFCTKPALSFQYKPKDVGDTTALSRLPWSSRPATKMEDLIIYHPSTINNSLNFSIFITSYQPFANLRWHDTKFKTKQR